MRKHLMIMAIYFKLNFASALEYRASFFAQAFAMALSNSSFIFFWWIAFGQIGGRIAGYSFEDVLFIWAVTSSGYGLSYIFFANAPRLTELITTGELDTYLLQPCNLLINIVCAKTTLSAYGDLVYGFVIMACFYPANAAAWAWFFYGVVLYCLLLTAIALGAHSLSFYFGDASTLGVMATEFAINFSIYPKSIYAPLVRVLMYCAIPVGIAVHLPLDLLKEHSLFFAIAGIAGTGAYCAFACWFFYRGLSRYESGNTIVVKL